MKKFVTILCLSIFALLGLLQMSMHTATQAAPSWMYKHVHACSDAQAGQAHCMAIVKVPTGRFPHALLDTPSGLTPQDLQSAYNLPSLERGDGQTIAIIDAYDHPNAETDLAVYRSMFGLTPCTTANGCFQKVDQNGGTHYPKADPSWAAEIALDLDMASAVCPRCHILLVEANSSSFWSLGTAVNTAVRLGATVVSNSYGGKENFFESLFYAGYYKHPGVVITASSGDNGYEVQIPAAYTSVIAVGGTSLSRDTNSRGWTETAWSGAGSGCSSYTPKPDWQKDTGCQHRTVADVSAVADPQTGVSVYSTYGNFRGWFTIGGTSASSPIIAGVYALAGNASRVTGSYLYSHADELYDITSGSNGSCTSSYQCNASSGYDGPTGLGTPNGLGAF